MFFTGPWRSLFDRYADSKADLVGMLEDVSHGDGFGWKKGCRWADNSSCYTRGARLPCRLCKTWWPTLRVSRALGSQILEDLMGGATGNHEALPGAVCARLGPGRCSRTTLSAQDLGAFVLGNWNALRETSSELQGMEAGAYERFRFALPGLLRLRGKTARSLRTSQLLHPIKCAADPQAGFAQFLASGSGTRQERTMWREMANQTFPEWRRSMCCNLGRCAADGASQLHRGLSNSGEASV